MMNEMIVWVRKVRALVFSMAYQTRPSTERNQVESEVKESD